MKFLRSLFSENGDVSMVRFMSLLSLIFGGVLALRGQDTSVLIFVGSAFSAKVAQKIIETKNSKTTDSSSSIPS